MKTTRTHPSSRHNMNRPSPLRWRAVILISGITHPRPCAKEPTRSSGRPPILKTCRKLRQLETRPSDRAPNQWNVFPTRDSSQTSIPLRNSVTTSTSWERVAVAARAPTSRGMVSNQISLRRLSLKRTRRILPAHSAMLTKKIKWKIHSSRRCTVLEWATNLHHSPLPTATRRVKERATPLIRSRGSGSCREYTVCARTCQTRARWGFNCRRVIRDQGLKLRQFAW